MVKRVPKPVLDRWDKLPPIGAYFITVTNTSFYDQIREDAEAGATNWTINRHARPGDSVGLYVKQPVGAVVAIASVETVPVLCEDPSSPWFKSYFADMVGLMMLKYPISRKKLLKELEGWGYFKQPRQSVRIPLEFTDRFSRLVTEALGREVADIRRACEVITGEQ